jgi:diacylglycerol kinase family enzyme
LRVLLIHNPGAGDERHGRDELVRALTSAAHEVDYRSADGLDWEETLSAEPDLFAVAGGDGTVTKAFKGLAGRPTPVTLIPLGTANNIAETLGLTTSSPDELIAAWPEFVPRPFDIGRAIAPSGRRPFVEAAGGGLLAELFRRAEEERGEPDDKVRQGLELLREALAGAKPRRWEIELDGADLSGELLGVEAMNIREIGPELRLAPGADPGDALLDVVLIGEEQRHALRAYVDARLDGGTAPLPALSAHRGRELTLRPPPGAPLHVDDDRWPVEGGGPIVVRAGAQRVKALVPERAPAVSA